MDFAPVYLIQRFFYRIFEFFKHWYVDGSRAFGRNFMGTIAGIDHSLAIRETVRHFFEPLYKDYTVVGRILGVIFRTGRILIAFVAYIFVAAIFLLAYFVWILIPALIIYYAARTN